MNCYLCFFLTEIECDLEPPLDHQTPRRKNICLITKLVVITDALAIGGNTKGVFSTSLHMELFQC